MRMRSLHVSNLWSFDDFKLDFDAGLTVVVGPNGSGKTNVVRVLDLVSKLVDWADERSRLAAPPPAPTDAVLSSYVQAMHDGSQPGTPIEVCLGIELTSGPERARIVALVRAAILTMLVEDSPARDEARKAQLSAWVTDEIDEEKLSSLFKGALVFRHPSYEDALWDARYEFEHGGARYDWILYSTGSRASIVRHGAVTDPTAPETRICEALLGQASYTSPAPDLPDPLPHFSLDAMCLSPGKSLANLVVRLGTGAFNDQHAPFRAAANLLDFPASGPTGQPAYGLSRALRLCLTEGLVVLGEQFRGLGVGGTIPWRAGIYPWDLVAGPVPPRDPGFLPLRLFQLKNGPTARDREAFMEIRRQFERLAPGRSFDVTFTAAKLPVSVTGPIGAGQVAVAGGDSQGGDDQGQPGSIVTVVAWNEASDGKRRERPIQLFGSGTWEALVLAEVLVKREGRLMVLDEPGVTFHPTWQSALRAELRGSTGQLLLVTHSPSLVPMDKPEDLPRLVRISNDHGASRSHRLPASLAAAEASKMTRVLALSADARSLLFCRGAVIVSGETELGALPIWCANSKAAEKWGTPSDLDIAFYSVAGDGGFGNVLSVLHGFGIPWVLVCDGKSFDIAENWGAHVFRQLERAGIDLPELTEFTRRMNDGGKPQRVMTQGLWDEQVNLGSRYGVLTLTTSWSGHEESIEGFFERVAPSKLAEAAGEVGTGSKIRKGRWVAQETPCPPEIEDFYQQVIRALQGEGIERDCVPEGLSEARSTFPR